MYTKHILEYIPILEYMRIYLYSFALSVSYHIFIESIYLSISILCLTVFDMCVCFRIRSEPFQRPAFSAVRRPLWSSALLMPKVYPPAYATCHRGVHFAKVGKECGKVLYLKMSTSECFFFFAILYH